LLNLPLLNPDVTSFQGHSFKISVTRPLPSIIYFPHVIHLSFSGSEQPATRFTRFILRTKILFFY